jgi:hypothetical protein
VRLPVITAAVLATVGLTAARPPAAVAIKAQVRATVRTSRARVTVLAVDVEARRFTLNVSARDPAAYLKHRYARVVETVYRVTGRFRFIYQRVFAARSATAVFSFSQIPESGGAYQTSWHIDSRYVACARDLPLDFEVDPEHAAPPCPAR